MLKIKLSLKLFADTQREFLIEVWALRLCRHKEEPEIQLGLENRKTFNQSAFKW